MTRARLLATLAALWQTDELRPARITVEDEQTLLLVEQLLQSASATAKDNPLNSDLPI